MLLMLAAPSTANAAQLTMSNGELRYTAATGRVNDVTFDQTAPGTVRVTRDSAPDQDEDQITATGCAAATPGDDYTCSGVTRIVADVGDRSDRITATGVETLPATLSAGDGNDAIDSGAGDDTLSGGAGNDVLNAGSGNDTLNGDAGDDALEGFLGNDALRGGDGNDLLRPNTGTDTLTGGDGIDRAVYAEKNTPRFSLDGLPNDGEAGENDLIGADVEDIEGAAPGSGTVTMVGDGRSNRLTVTGGRGDLTGGEGTDVLEGGALDDIMRARDGSPDTILCGAGTDTVEADTLDVVSTTCENVSTQAAPGGPFDDHPPVLAWTAPAANATLSADEPTTLTANATDDRGVVRVQFFDDDRLLCEDTSAPFSCVFQPRGGDIGRNTLLAVGIDGASQTTTLVRAVTVRRFTPPDLELSVRPSRDRRTPFRFRLTGQLKRPSTVAPSQGCSGDVTVTAKAGSRTATTRRVKLTRTCNYSLTLSYNKRPASRLRVTARFAGNEVLASKTSRTRTIRLG
jgi:Ca2+-binding RTX toxin-like protein